MLCRFPCKNRLNPASLPTEELRRKLEALGVPRERHRLGELIAMLPARLDGRPYEDFDADCVAEVFVYLVSKGVLDVANLEVALQLQWGERLCHFYRREEELVSLLGTFFRQGVARNERCVWLATAAISDRVREEIDPLAEVLEEGDCTLPREERRAVAEGYSGLRICGEALALEIDAHAPRTKALSTYCANRLQPGEIVLLLREHDGALVRSRAGWQRVHRFEEPDGHDTQLA